MLLFVALNPLWPRTARALPSFAQQTGQPCTTCHIGGFGPQLTSFGRAFKIGGYTMGGGDGWPSKLPLSAMMLGSFTHTGRSRPDPPAPHTGRNDNPALDQISVFYAGRISDWAGAFIQGTYDGVARSFALDNADIRPFTTDVDLGSKELRVGATINNGPTVQDPYNSIAWGFPFAASALAPTPAAQTLLGGGLIGNSIGLTAYGWYDRHLYLEVGGYGTYGPSLLRAAGTTYGPGSTASLAPYARIAYEREFGDGHVAHVGAMVLHANLNPTTGSYSTDGSLGHNAYTDWAFDLGYQFVNGGDHVFSAYGMLISESASLDGATAAGGSSQRRNNLWQFNANLTYFYRNTYGLNLGWQARWGKANSALYQPFPVDGSANGKPNSNAFIIEADWVPFGKADSWASPWANLKLGLQYTLYTRFNGGTRNYDGFGRSAADNDTIFAFAWLAF